MQLKLTTDNEKAIKWFSKLHFETNKCIDKVHMIEMFRQEALYDKPSYVGASELDLSKQHIMAFHYNAIRGKFEGKSDLIYSDTDSLVYDIQNHIFTSGSAWPVNTLTCQIANERISMITPTRRC